MVYACRELPSMCWRERLGRLRPRSKAVEGRTPRDLGEGRSREIGSELEPTWPPAFPSGLLEAAGIDDRQARHLAEIENAFSP
jgi:hypothetical protein